MRDREAFMLAYTDKQDLDGRRLHEVPLQRLFQVDGEWVEEEDEELDEAKLRTLRRRLKQEHGSNETSAPGRRLKTLFLRKEFELLYRAPGSILEEKALQEVQSIETGLRNLKGPTTAQSFLPKPAIRALFSFFEHEGVEAIFDKLEDLPHEAKLSYNLEIQA
ncbi:unnamed protein product [Effrenium voratum]|nr:unnamed protein product [Effrenium voratum]